MKVRINLGPVQTSNFSCAEPNTCSSRPKYLKDRQFESDVELNASNLILQARENNDQLRNIQFGRSLLARNTGGKAYTRRIILYLAYQFDFSRSTATTASPLASFGSNLECTLDFIYCDIKITFLSLFDFLVQFITFLEETRKNRRGKHEFSVLLLLNHSTVSAEEKETVARVILKVFSSGCMRPGSH